jgi:hypothetical protein
VQLHFPDSVRSGLRSGSTEETSAPPSQLHPLIQFDGSSRFPLPTFGVILGKTTARFSFSRHLHLLCRLLYQQLNSDTVVLPHPLTQDVDC